MRSHRDVSRRLTRLELRRKFARNETAKFLDFQDFLASDEGQRSLAALPPERQAELRQADHFCGEDFRRIAAYPPIRVEIDARLEQWKRARGFLGRGKDLLSDH